MGDPFMRLERPDLGVFLAAAAIVLNWLLLPGTQLLNCLDSLGGVNLDFDAPIERVRRSLAIGFGIAMRQGFELQGRAAEEI
jgi:hypothetical protein